MRSFLRRYLTGKLLFLFSCVCYLVTQPRVACAQKTTNQSRTLLEVSSGFYMVEKNATVDLDSSLSITSHHFRLSRASVITEGMDDISAGRDCQWMDKGGIDSIKKMLAKPNDKSAQARLSLLLGAYYAFYPGLRTKYVDSGIFYLKYAKEICDVLQKSQWSSQCAILLGKCYFKRNDVLTGKKWFQLVDNQTGIAPALKAKSLNYQGMYCPFLATTTGYRLDCLNKALHIYKQLADTGNQINTLMNTAYLSFANQNIKDAEDAANASLSLQQLNHFNYSHYTYDLLAYLANRQIE